MSAITVTKFQISHRKPLLTLITEFLVTNTRLISPPHKLLHLLQDSGNEWSHSNPYPAGFFTQKCLSVLQKYVNKQKLRFSQSVDFWLVWHLSEFIKKSRYRMLYSAWDKTWRFSPFPPLPSRFSSKFLMSSALNSDLKSGLLKSDASWLVKLSVSEGSSFTENKDKKMFKNRLSFTSTSFGFVSKHWT